MVEDFESVLISLGSKDSNIMWALQIARSALTVIININPPYMQIV